MVWFVLNAMARGLRRMPLSGDVPWWVAILIVGGGGAGARRARRPRPRWRRWRASGRAPAAFSRRSTRRCRGSPRPTASTRWRWSTGCSTGSARDDGARGGGGMIALVSHFAIVGVYVGFLLVDQAFFGEASSARPDPDARARARLVLGAGRGGDRDLPLGHDRRQRATAGLSYLVLLAFGSSTPSSSPRRSSSSTTSRPSARSSGRCSRLLRADAVPDGRADARRARGVGRWSP